MIEEDIAGDVLQLQKDEPTNLFEINKFYLMDNTDYFNLVPDNSVDLILTDPPYDIDMRSARHHDAMGKMVRKGTAYMEMYDLVNGYDYNIFAEFIRVQKKVNTLIFCSEQQLPGIIGWWSEKGYNTRIYIWHKSNATPFVHLHMHNNIEFILHVKEKGSYFNNKATLFEKSRVLKFSKDSNEARIHPTQKPPLLLERLIKLFSKPGDVICDPFAGSGSILKASHVSKRQFTGCELLEKYYTPGEQSLKSLTSLMQLFN